MLRFNDRLVVKLTDRPTRSPNLENKTPVLTSSLIMYSFAWLCSTSSVSSMTRQFSERIKKHKPIWLGYSSTKTISGTTAMHFSDLRNRFDDDAFKTLYRVTRNIPKVFRHQHLGTTEAVCKKTIGQVASILLAANPCHFVNGARCLS